MEKLSHMLFETDSQEKLDQVLALLPKGNNTLRDDIIISTIAIDTYGNGVLDFNEHPNLVYSEVTGPLYGYYEKGQLKEGMHYLIPKIENMRLPKWQYTVDLLTANYESRLTFKFWHDILLNEEELLTFIKANADWSFAVSSDA